MNVSDVNKGTGDHRGNEDHGRMFSQTSVLSVVIVVFLLTGAGRGCADVGGGMDTVPSPPGSFSIYALSRGKGVPEEARKVLDQARQILKQGQEQGEVTRLVERRIGLEGETRLCAEFVDETVADRFFHQLDQLSLGVDLINIKKGICPP